MRSGNPALGDTFLDVGSGQLSDRSQGVMTMDGTVNKTAILLALTVMMAGFTWSMVDGPETVARVMPLTIGGAIAGLVLALITVFKKTWAPVTAPLYALAEGLFIGGISAWFELRFPGIVMQAVGLTFGVFAAMLALYRSRVIKVTEKFKMGVAAATLGIFAFYLINFVASFFGWSSSLLDSTNGSMMSIGFSLIVVGIAALNLVLDFDLVEEGVNGGAPKFMEWYAGFALLVTLVWLYIEMLRLLAKLQSRE
ncbi:Bax inhibitor-1/YccA family protein [Pseudomarimonas arenosa]|uniref:Bax inhibitor-1/YccA family protein n=1 Tax=Pseudomarimonas arenosa TaxID=2774145 RepID=A0AAW3ZNC5_9GAMM|nr:Bax inhibitor-1/YccA family protein [Pseudomarimonas arenosa]MBD8525866.1 Bax inhibitor-1/YccA family protein [Pseudomarimonas arenosa]